MATEETASRVKEDRSKQKRHMAGRGHECVYVRV